MRDRVPSEMTEIDPATEEEVIDDYLRGKQQKKEDYYEKKLNEIKQWALFVGIFRDVLRARTNMQRIFWFLVAVLTVGMCAFQLTLLFTTYLANPTQTKISSKVNTSILFPIVTVCTYARVNSTKIREMNISNDLLAYMMSAYKGMYLFYNEFNIRQKQEALDLEYREFLRTQQHTNFSLTRFFIDSGFDCKEFLKSCMFQGTDFDCCVNNEQQTPILSDVGKCFVVQSPNFKSQTIPGPSGGLKIFIQNHAKQYPATMVNSNPDLGVQIHIIHPLASALISAGPLVIFPGTHGLVNLNAVYQKLKKNPNDKSSCVDDRKLNYFSSYSFEGCFTECIADMTLKTCGCIQIGSVPNYTVLKPEQLCDPARATSCVQPLLQANNMGFLWDIYDIKTNCHCPLPCEQWTYQRAVSYSSAPNPGYAYARSILTNDPTTNDTLGSDDEIILDIFFDSLVYQTVLENDMISYTTFLSSIGGQLSIWLGIRLVTLVHIVYYILVGISALVPHWAVKIRRVGGKVAESMPGGFGQFKKSLFSSLQDLSSNTESVVTTPAPTTPGPRSSSIKKRGLPVGRVEQQENMENFFTAEALPPKPLPHSPPPPIQIEKEPYM